AVRARFEHPARPVRLRGGKEPSGAETEISQLDPGDPHQEDSRDGQGQTRLHAELLDPRRFLLRGDPGPAVSARTRSPETGQADPRDLEIGDRPGRTPFEARPP